MKTYDLTEELNNIDGRFFMEEVRYGFYITSMMKRYWASQLRTLSEVDKVCKRHGLKWFAECGTLLGAVRHEGYIPWDDDLDICMLRDDLVEFSKYAKEEMPEGYLLLNIHTAPKYEYMISNIANSHSICTDPDFLKRNFGCPYVTGVDIFPLDALSPDADTEEERRQQLQEIVDASNHIAAVGLDHPVVKNMLTALSGRHHYTIHRDERAQRDLRLLAEKIYMKYPMAEAEEIALMPFWVSNHNHNFPKAAYEETVYLPFEYVHIPAPIGYDEILGRIYGDYMKIYKGGGLHEYPAFAAQERILAKEAGGANPYRYTMPKELPAARSIKNDREVCAEMSGMLTGAHSNIQLLVNAGNADSAAELLQGCQNLAISLGTYIEEHVKGGEEAVHKLEEYCELLYEVSSAWNGEESVKLLDDTIRAEEEILGRIFERAHREVLFIPCRAEWWPSMEREWRRCTENENCDVYVTPIPYMIRDSYGEERSTCDDSELFPGYVTITKLADYDIEKRKPDEVYIQAPYDGWNSMFLVPEYYYSENLVKKVKKLTYIPCFEADLPQESGDKNEKTLKVMAEQPALVYVDEILVKDEATRKAYLEALVRISGEDTREYWNAKLAARNAKEQAAAPERKGAEKKCLLFQLNIAFIEKYRERALEKVKEVLDILAGKHEVLDCVFVPHETLLDGVEEEGATGELCRQVLDMVKSSPYIIYGSKDEVLSDPDRITAYYGNPGCLASICANEGKPAMIMAVL
ncbi:MAG: LicD family protein [Lachnospiraceae bacterium]|nr:LicD family protein [Lachnospiraceae bacterium]